MTTRIDTIDWIIQPDDQMWVESAASLRTIVQAAVDRTRVTMRLDRLRDLPQGSSSSSCIFLHAHAHSLAQIVEAVARVPHRCWVIVSGGEEVLIEELAVLYGHPRVAMFPFAYGNESHVRSWFHAWLRHNFTLEAFDDVRGELVCPTENLPPVIARRLLSSLTPLQVTLAGYARIRAMGEPARAWLADTMALLNHAAMDAGDVAALLLNLRPTEGGTALGRRLRAVADGVKGIPDTDAALDAFRADVDAVSAGLLAISEETPEAAELCATPVEQLRHLRAAVTDLRHALERGDAVPDRVRQLLSSEAARDALVAVMTAAAPPYGPEKWLARFVGPGSILPVPEECVRMNGDLALLCWLAETGEYARTLSRLSHDEVNNGGMAVATSCEYFVRARRRGLEIPERVHRNLRLATQRWVEALPLLVGFVTDIRRLFGLVTTGRFVHEMADAVERMMSIPQRLERIDALSIEEIEDIRSDIMAVARLYKAMAIHRDFGDYFLDVDASLLEKGHDALA